MGKFLVPHMLWFCSFWTCLFFKQRESMPSNTQFLLILEHQTRAFSSKSRRISCLALHKGFDPRARKQAKCLWIHEKHYLFVLIPGHETKGISSRSCETSCPALRICFHPRASNDGDFVKISCPALHKRFQPWAWKQSKMFVNSCPTLLICFDPRAWVEGVFFNNMQVFMPNITHLFWF